VKLYNHAKGVLAGHGYKKVSILILSVLVGVGVFTLAVVLPIFRRLSMPAIPEFPDCTGQPAVVVHYLQRMNNEAMQMPASDETVGKLAMAYHAHMFYDQAQQCYGRAIALNPKEWRWMYYAGVLHEELGDSKAAIQYLRDVVERNPAMSQAWFRLGNSYLKTRSYADADSAFRRVLQLKDHAAEDRSGTGALSHGVFPLTAYAMLQLARVQSLQKQSADAKALLEELIHTNPTFGPAYRLLGSLYQESGEREKGLDYEMRAGDFVSYVPPPDPMYDALVLCSRNTDFITTQIDIAEKREAYEWTLTLIDHILEYSPHDGDALTRRLKLALDTQESDGVEPLVRAYAQLYGRDEARLMDMAKYLRYRGEYESSVTLLKRVITVNPKAMDAHIEFVKMLKTFKQYGMGIQYCDEVIAAEPKDAGIRIALAELLIQAGKIDRAKEQLKIAQGLHPDEKVRYLMLARMAKKTGDVQSAVRYFRKALSIDPHDAITQLELGELLLELRKWDEALRHFQSSLNASPNDLDLIERYAWILAACPDGKIRNGKRALESANRLSLMRKRTVEQDIRCGMTLAVAYGEMKQFDRAIEVANKHLDKAKTLRQKEYARKLSSLLQLLQSRKPYRL
jgi:tetratricopeptide (TPR) repeat protein